MQVAQGGLQKKRSVLLQLPAIKMDKSGGKIQKETLKLKDAFQVFLLQIWKNIKQLRSFNIYIYINMY